MIAGLFSLGITAEALWSEYRLEAAILWGASIFPKISDRKRRLSPTILRVGKL